MNCATCHRCRDISSLVESLQLALAVVPDYRVAERRRTKPSTVKRVNAGIGVNGRGERIRTSDLLVPNQALYQAEPRPDEERNLQYTTDRSKSELYQRLFDPDQLKFDRIFAEGPEGAGGVKSAIPDRGNLA